MEVKTAQFPEAAVRELGNPRSRAFLKLLPAIQGQRRLEALATFADPDAAQAYGAAIREEVVSRLPELLEEFEQKAAANGARVFWAQDAREANDYILALARERGVKYVTKGKSMVTEETGLNRVLEDHGVAAWETDLGEFIIQLLHLPPFHIVGPAINVPVEAVRDIFLEKIGLQEPTLEPGKLGYAARLFLRDKFHHVQMGITGINFAVAQTGSILNVENEGNIRMNKSSPRTQVSIMTLEKVVPTMADAIHLARLLCRNCSGKKMTGYLTLDSGPRKRGEADGPEELVIVILDNGRSRIYGDPKMRDVLRCIRCGACLSGCPVYQQVGGYPYGWAYSGPMGQVLNPLLLGFSGTRHLYRATTLCGNCRKICPAGINHPDLFLYYRYREVQARANLGGKNIQARENDFFRVWSWAVKDPWKWNWGIRLLRPLAKRYLREGRAGKGPLAPWLKNRDLPAMARKTFHERWEEMNHRGNS